MPVMSNECDLLSLFNVQEDLLVNNRQLRWWRMLWIIPKRDF